MEALHLCVARHVCHAHTSGILCGLCRIVLVVDLLKRPVSTGRTVIPILTDRRVLLTFIQVKKNGEEGAVAEGTARA